ncbi:hypothetical protein [Nocardioides sp. B-3]|uniref:hypothetical protein n=1 Tax=Nocardioides sp. B-3 TaxID=2895565 RepID=UPI003FA5ADFC
MALHEQAEIRGEQLRIAMAAPTGKAAARLEHAVRDNRVRSATPTGRGWRGSAR